MSDLVGNPEDRFSHNEAHFIILHVHNLLKKCRQKSKQCDLDQFDLGLQILFKSNKCPFGVIHSIMKANFENNSPYC